VESTSHKLAFKYTSLVSGSDVYKLADLCALESSYFFGVRVGCAFCLVDNHNSRALHTLFVLFFYSGNECISSVIVCDLLILRQRLL